MIPEKLQESLSGGEAAGKPLNQGDALKHTGLYIGWIAGILLIGGLLWFFTQSLRTTLLLQTVNRVLATAQDSRRLERFIPQSGRWGRIPWGSWYTLKDSADQALVFSVMSEGMFLPCMAVVSTATGKVIDHKLVPLTSHAEQTLKHIPRGVINAYIGRIESPALSPSFGNSGGRTGADRQ
ncbi:MAG: hypothetical protein LBQ30_06015 [Treponema sp.]|jgi:hypothetical protein|nr:hypothetical protein [Treponema sp.]